MKLHARAQAHNNEAENRGGGGELQKELMLRTGKLQKELRLKIIESTCRLNQVH